MGFLVAGLKLSDDLFENNILGPDKTLEVEGIVRFFHISPDLKKRPVKLASSKPVLFTVSYTCTVPVRGTYPLFGWQPAEPG